MAQGPLPQWEPIGGYGSGIYEATDPHGVTWRLHLVEQPTIDDPLPPGYRLASRDNPTDPTHITAAGGLYHALDLAGMQISRDTVQDDPEGARRQLGLDTASSDARDTEK